MGRATVASGGCRRRTWRHADFPGRGSGDGPVHQGTEPSPAPDDPEPTPTEIRVHRGGRGLSAIECQLNELTGRRSLLTPED